MKRLELRSARSPTRRSWRRRFRVEASLVLL
jgi:hypothetical protein